MNIWNVSGYYWKCKRKSFKSTLHSTILQTLSIFRGFTTHRLKQNNDFKSLNKALRIIDLVSPKSHHGNKQHCHLQLVQDLLQSHTKNFSEEKSSNDFAVPCFRNQIPSALMLPSFSFMDDAFSGVFELHREGLRIDMSVLPHALSDCGYRGNLHWGTQLHCLVVKDGMFVNVYVGSSLISMYSKCGDLHSASKVFEEMPVRNVVSWTALISGFAQIYQVEACLQLYRQMRQSTLKPNDFTLTSLLSACVGNGSLGQGKIVHCLAILSGYALHGLAWKAIDLFEKMKKQNLKPDCITFLGVLSSCRHAGLVKQGHMYFNLMVEYGVEPDLGHYSCIVDLLCRTGLVEEGRKFILDMPIQPNAIIWGSLLSSCRLHNNVWIGIEAAENRLALEPSCAATHVQLAKLYARVGMWDQVAKVLKSMKDTEIKMNPGYSWIEIGNEVISFKADDTTNSRMKEVFCMLEVLKCQLTLDHVP